MVNPTPAKRGIRGIRGRHRPPSPSRLLVIGIGLAVAFTATAAVALLRPVIRETFVTSGTPGLSSPTAGDGEQAVALTSPSAKPTATPSPPAPPSPRPSASTEYDKTTTMENQVTTLINKERVKAGCKTVKNDPRLQKAARAHSTDMAKNNYFSHTGQNGSTFVTRVAAQGYPKNDAAGENIAYGYRTAEDVVKGWMNSKGHRSNILNCGSRSTGVGLAYRGNTPYWTQVFGRR